MEVIDGIAEIYRVEHKVTRQGPYDLDDDMTNDGLVAMYDDHCTENGHPSAEHDSGIGWGVRRRHHYFGFTRREQLVQWFAGYYADLDSAGLVVATYAIDADLVIDGDKQALFERAMAELITTTPIHTFCKGLTA